MNRRWTNIVTVLALIAFAGCAGSNPHANTRKAGYATKAIPAKFKMNSSSLLDDVRMYYRVQLYETEASGTGADNAELVFQIKPGPDQIILKSRTLRITANGKSFEWPGREWDDITDAPVVKGTITAVRLGYDDLVTIAEAEHVEGTLGGQNFDWTYQNREPIRNFLAYVKARQ